jgi:hypothetical protein
MEYLSAIKEFFLIKEALGGALGAFITLCGCHFAVLDVGVRKNQPLHKEPLLKQLVFILVGWIVAAAFAEDQATLPFLIYVSVGAGWIYILRGLISSAQVIGAAITSRNKAIINSALGGEE